jgi:Uncharacterised nucleotidyltransferase
VYLNSVTDDRERLVALLTALEDPTQAISLPSDDAHLISGARYHRLTPLLSAVCGNSLPPQLAESFRRDRLISAARHLMLGQVAEECINALTAARVPTILLKGLEYQVRLYSDAGTRPTADVDVLVPNECRRTAFGVLDRLGFEPRAAAPGFDDPDYHEVAWTRGSVEVDLHMALAPLARCRIDYRAIWDRATTLRLGKTDTQALAPAHAAIFHALHMAIDHFEIPAIYLVDMARLIPDAVQAAEAEACARLWRCRRPLATAAALAATFLPRAGLALRNLAPPGFVGRRVIDRFGNLTPLPRRQQLVRKLAHIDSWGHVARYIAVQSRRTVRERMEQALRRRSARERLSL